MITTPDFDFYWARPEDEADIRALVGAVAMPGSVAVRFAREPDYFLGTSIMGNPCQVLVVRHRPDGTLAGIACRAESRAFINGQPATLGYIGQIRVAQAFRGRWLVHLGAQAFREASPEGLLYFGVIASENPRARQLLVGARPPCGLQVRFISGLTTCAILLRPMHSFVVPGVQIQPADVERLPEVINFLNGHGSKRQFFPVYTLEDFIGGAKMRGLRPQDIRVARRGGTVVGVMAAWDQTAYKQDVVDSYGPALRRLSPVYNLAARMLGMKPLTPPGQAMPLAFAACTCVADDDLAVMRALLSACLKDAYDRGKAYLMMGLADEDPLLLVARRYFHIAYHSDLYAVSWSAEAVQRVDGRIPYVEIATL